ncbi:hypothetical protein ACH4UR_31675 [Streptomyces lydicus]|uniref:hypothetical protein n=1 Tax=Streptomyces lydicus TaxID=47763 RepID=UPI00340BA12E
MTAAAGAALVLAATPAIAGSDLSMETGGGGYGGALFHHEGETVTVCDFARDGKAVTAYLGFFEPTGSRRVSVTNAKGAGGGCVTKDFSVVEGSRVVMQVCLRQGSTVSHCSARRWTTA